MASAAIPVYLLARRVGVGWSSSLWAGALAVAVPWMVLSSFLLTEVVAYPAFCWALLALTHATVRRTALTDALALGAIGVAVFARAQFLLLLAAFALAVVVDALLEARGAWRIRGATLWRTRKPLLARLSRDGRRGDRPRARAANCPACSARTRRPRAGSRLDLETLQLALEQVAVLRSRTRDPSVRRPGQPG